MAFILDSKFPRWTKRVDFTQELLLADFSRKDMFKHVANVVKDDETSRQTVIRFDPVIDKEDWKKKVEWVYIFTIDGFVVKIGQTGDSLHGRCGSYLCGHHVPERGKSRDMSKTNAFLYHTFEHYIGEGHRVEMWGYEIPRVMNTVALPSGVKEIAAKVAHAYEADVLDLYAKEAGHFPVLSDNSDPSLRTVKQKKPAQVPALEA
jgi:hypothetical protein